MSTYEIGAFSEQQLLDLGCNGTDIGYGDTFIMPSSNDTLIEVWDNDQYLSGDSWSNEQANDSYGQNATVTTDGVIQTQGNQIYAESYHWVWGSDGNWYIMIEIEAECDGQDYFSFYGDIPPAGTHLTVNCGGNVTCDWINYCDLQDNNNITPPLAVNDAIAINEAETGNLNLLDNDVDLDGGTITVTAVEGGDLGSPFEVTSAEGYSAMVTVYADGSMTVVPGPMFAMLADGETTSISFDYTITDNDGLTSTATVSVEVNGELTLDAMDDAVIVSETEGAGDIDGNVLDNDTIDGVAYEGNVDAVLGDAANVGNWVEGSNGGRIKINADGSYDFDAEGDFDALKDGQTAETTFTYQISENGTVIPQHNILFVFDVSNSTVSLDGDNGFVGTGVGDVNGDGRADTVLDAQIVAAKAVVQDLLDKGIDPANVNIGISTFSGVDTSGASSFNHATVDAQTLGTFSLDDANIMSTFDSIASGSWTNYEAGLGEAQNWFDANADAGEENVMYFLSDGRPITGFDHYGNYVEQSAADYASELAGIESYGTAIHAIGVGANSSLTALDGIDNTGGAVQVLDAASMTAEMLSSHDYVAAVDTATITVTVNGKTVFDAVNDTMTVSEDETGGDADLLDGGAASVLANDDEDGAAYTGNVFSVEGDVANVGQAITGSAGGRLTINADGTVDFDANGEFDGLRDGETAQTVFTYEIAGGETATVTVTVNGDTDYTANADTLTVSEDETFGALDTLDSGETSILANDLDEVDAYAGDVLKVQGDAVNVGTAVAGSNGGLLLVNADGTVDFSANGEFDGLRDGETAETTFTYQIEDGEMATVTVTVNGDTDYTAVADTLTVTEDETAGDAETLDTGETSVLANDLDEADAYAGDVLAVNGTAANVAAVVDGSNGGRLTINADGTLDFDANGDFDGLRDNETALTEFTYQIEDGEMATVIVTVNGDTDYTAVNDTMTVDATEGAGDVDFLDSGAASVLANDLDEADAYAGDVLTVGNDANNVGMVVAGSNGGTLKIAADGSVDFDAAGDFNNLLSGQSATTTFTYSIEDGETASVVVTVQGQTVRDANDDFITVFASETSGDVELMDNGDADILDNDTQNGGDYTETVATVNGSVTNVNAQIAGSNGGFATISANGEIDFDADGAFAYLLEGEEAFTTFDYTIQGGEAATVTVKVVGETEREALNDAITVSETETSGDNDGNVLSNDTEEGGAYTGDVLKVDGLAANVGAQIVGANGGLLTLNADGSFDFDANDEFDFLAEGQSADTSFTYEIEGGETATLTVTVEGEDDVVQGPAVNVAIMMQSSATMFAQGDIQNFVPDWGDYNGDGIANQQIDLAYLMIETFVPQAFADASAAGTSLNISLIDFDDSMGSSSGYTLVNNTDSINGQITAKVANDDSADYGNAFDNANDFFTDVSAAGDTNVVFFIGNGFQTDPWQTEKAQLVADHSVSVDAYLTDLVVNVNDANYVNLSSMDDDGFVDLIYTDDAANTGGFGVAQDALSIMDLV